MWNKTTPIQENYMYVNDCTYPNSDSIDFFKCLWI